MLFPKLPQSQALKFQRRIRAIGTAVPFPSRGSAVSNDLSAYCLVRAGESFFRVFRSCRKRLRERYCSILGNRFQSSFLKALSSGPDRKLAKFPRVANTLYIPRLRRNGEGRVWLFYR
jgi:hypothetical protein